MTHRSLAWLTILAALVLDAACGLAFAVFQHIPAWHGLYCAVANAVTVGGDVSPTTAAGYGITAVECLLVVPLFAATLSLFTSALAGSHVTASEERVKAHVEDQLSAQDSSDQTRAAITGLGEQIAALAGVVREVMAARLEHESGVAADARAARSAAESAFVATQALATVATNRPGPAELVAAVQEATEAVRQVHQAVTAPPAAPDPGPAGRGM